MEETNLFDTYIEAAKCAQIFAGLGGECDEFMQFLQLEWESYAKEFSPEQERHFYQEIKWYKEYGEDPTFKKRDWRESFSGRNHFGTIV